MSRGSRVRSPPGVANGACSVMVIIGASQALDPGSIPGRRSSAFWGISSIGRVRALQARGTGIETPMLHIFGSSQLLGDAVLVIVHADGIHHQAWMAERSKALDSSSSLSGGVGSNPTPSNPVIFVLPPPRPPRLLRERQAPPARAIGLVV